jgi:hypothetical protein
VDCPESDEDLRLYKTSKFTALGNAQFLNVTAGNNGASLTNKAITPTLAVTHTNWDMFRAYIDEHKNLRLRIEECAELDEATQYFTTLTKRQRGTPPLHSA